jgi:hypothetical protein
LYAENKRQLNSGTKKNSKKIELLKKSEKVFSSSLFFYQRLGALRQWFSTFSGSSLDTIVFVSFLIVGLRTIFNKCPGEAVSKSPHRNASRWLKSPVLEQESVSCCARKKKKLRGKVRKSHTWETQTRKSPLWYD